MKPDGMMSARAIIMLILATRGPNKTNSRCRGPTGSDPGYHDDCVVKGQGCGASYAVDP